MSKLIVNETEYTISKFNDFNPGTLIFKFDGMTQEEVKNIFNGVSTIIIDDTNYKNIYLGTFFEDDKDGSARCNVFYNVSGDVIKEMQNTIDTLMTEIIPNLKGEA